MSVLSEPAVARAAAPAEPAPPPEPPPPEPVALAALAASLGIAFVTDLANRAPSAAFVERIPINFARRHGLLGLVADGDGPMPVVMGDLSAWEQLQLASRFLGRATDPAAGAAGRRARCDQRRLRAAHRPAQTFIERLDPIALGRELEGLHGPDDLLDLASRAPVVKLVSLVLFEAVQSRASDVHLQPRGGRADRPLPHRWGSARCAPPAQGAAGGDPQPGEGDGQDEHRREATAAGRARHRAGGRPIDRPARRHAAGQLRRAAGDPPAGQDQPAVRPARAGHGGRRTGPLPPTDPRRPRPDPGDRPDRQRQDDHALRRPAGDQLAGEEHPHAGGPDRVPPARREPDAGERAEGDDLRQRPAQRAAAGPPTSS